MGLSFYLFTRALHFDLMQDMSTEQFLLGLLRFVASHGTPCEIISEITLHNII